MYVFGKTGFNKYVENTYYAGKKSTTRKHYGEKKKLIQKLGIGEFTVHEQLASEHYGG